MSTCIFSKLLDLTAGPQGVVDIDVGWVQSITVEFFYLFFLYFMLHSSVGRELFFM